MDNWLLILVGAILLLTTLFGIHRGFIKLCVSMITLIVTLVAVQIATPYVSKFLKEATPLYSTIQDGILDTISGENVSETNDLSVNDQTQIINEFALPQSLKAALLENNNSEVYKILGVDLFKDYVSGYLANIIVNSIGFLLAFIVIFAILGIAIFALDIVSRLPGIHGLNKLAGGVLGFVEGLIVIWLLCLFVTAFSSTEWGAAIFAQIEKSIILSFIYDNNLFTKFIMTLVGNLL